MDEDGLGGRCADCDYSVRSHIAVESPAADIGVPAGWTPKEVCIPTKFKERWEYVKCHPFTTLTGANVVITGDGVKVSREKAETLVTKLGGTLKSSPVKALDFCVVLGQPVDSCTTGKALCARNYQTQGSPVRIIDEDEFLNLVKATLDEDDDDAAKLEPMPEPKVEWQDV